MPTANGDMWADVDSPGARRLLVAALDAFADDGYGATSTRAIAERAGLSNAAVFFHYRTKEELLYAISLAGHQSALEAVEAAVAAHTAAVDRVRACVEAAATWHARNHTLARVIQYELHSLTQPHLRAVAKLRRRFEAVLHDAVQAGVEGGDLTSEQPQQVADAIISLCIDVARWYRPSRQRSPQAVGTFYGELALLMLRRR